MFFMPSIMGVPAKTVTTAPSAINGPSGSSYPFLTFFVSNSAPPISPADTIAINADTSVG